MIEVSLLGPPRVERDGALLAFDTRKAVALLAHLALTDRPRPREALADLLWPGTDPDRARGALRRTLTTLRSAVGGEVVEATRDHVRLVAGPDVRVDVAEFRRLRAEGDLEGAAAAYGGDLLEGFAVRGAPDFEDWVRGEGEALRQELVAVLAGSAARREAAGDLSGALRDVRRWLDVDPLHEPAHQALIRLLALAGDRAAALTQYRECVRTLSRELGVPPLAETTALYTAISAGTLAPARPVSPPPAAVGGTATAAPPLVGRAGPVRSLVEAYDGVGPDGRVAVVTGEAGIGKSRLVEELAGRVRSAGGRVLVVRAYDDEAGLAYAPLADALRARAREDQRWLDRPGPAALEAVSRLVPEAGLPVTGTGLDGPAAETRFVAGLWDALLAAVEGDVPGLVVVEDAQWVDDATAAVVGYGVRRLQGRPALVAVTWRPPGDRPVQRAATQAARDSGAEVRLARLTREDVDELVAGAGVDTALAGPLWERSEGVPLLLVECLRAAPGPDEALPAGLRDVLRARLEPVSATARQVLSAAAVVGRSFGVEQVRSVSGRTDEETVGALEELLRRGLVREEPAGYDFAHDQLRSLVHDETSLARRRLLHGRAAEVAGTAAAARARHLHLAGRDAEAAVVHRQAAQEARTVYAHAEVLDHLRRATALGHPDPVEVLTATADVLTVLGDYAGALQVLEEAAAHADRGALAGVEHRLGRVQHRRGEWELAAHHLAAALAQTPAADLAGQARVTADLSLSTHSLGDDDRAADLARQAAALADEAGDDVARGQARNLLGLLASVRGDLDGAVGALRASVVSAEAAGDQDLRVAALNNLALAYRAGGDLDQATALTREALIGCQQIGDRHREAALHNNLADLAHAAGRPDEALDHLKTAVAIFAEVGEGDEPRPEVWKLVRW